MNMWSRCTLGGWLAITSAVLAQNASPQQPSVADATRTAPDTRAAEAVLSRVIDVSFNRLPLKQALDIVAKRASTQMVYRLDLVTRYTAPVSVHVTHITLGAALEIVLAGTSLKVLPLENGRVGIVESASGGEMAQAEGVIVGRVIDAKTQQPVRGVSITLDDSGRVARTDGEGHYRFAAVAAGGHRLTARSIGFARQTQLVTVTGDQTATADFTLDASVNTLDQVVVTATGEQRIRELGHVVASINADSLVKEAPITSMSELLTARVPGLQVITGNGGMAGGDISLRLRGTSTFNLNPEPIVIVDGVRYQSNNLIPHNGSYQEDFRGPGYGNTTQSPLNNLNPNDIETVEVVKGPSASTLYGPDAANGVIVITTKRGAPGKTKFQWYARPVSNSVPKSRLPKGYQIWSHTPTGEVFEGQCTLIQQYQNQQCILDSITVAQSLVTRDDYSFIAKSRPTWQYGASVSGGSQQLKYFLSGNYDSQMGVMRVPPALEKYLKQQLGVSALSDAVRNPNTLQDFTAHASMSSDIANNGHVNLVTSYAQTYQRMVFPSVFTTQLDVRGVPPSWLDTTSLRRPANFYFGDPAFALTTSEENSKHFTAALNGTTQLASWLSATALVGIDLNGVVGHSILPAGERSPTDDGEADEDRRDNVGRTVTLGTTALVHPGIFSFRTSFGAQYAYQRLDGMTINGYGLAPGSTSIGTLLNRYLYPVWNETASLGTYGEEVLGVNDRLFLTGSLRYDGSTTFGDAYHPHPYPKVGLSWIASDEPFLRNVPGLQQLRFRASYGAASRYPTSFMKFGSQTGYAVTVEGRNQNVFERIELANPTVRPERTRETEYGADLTLLADVTVGLTWHSRRTDDQLLELRNTQGLQRSWANVGDLQARGFEATVSAPLVDARLIRANLAFTYSHHTDRILSLGAMPDFKSSYGTGLAKGYPMGSVFVDRHLGKIVGVADTVGGHADGIVFENEVVVDTTKDFLGVTNPPNTFTLTPTVALVSEHLRLSAVVDRQTGFVRYDQLAQSCPNSGMCLAPFLTSTPLMEQARYARGYGFDFIVPGDFTRWRELNVTVDVPQRLIRWDLIHLRFTSATVSLQGRNLALWTKYNGSDPESRDREYNSASSNGIPQARAWSFRFDITP